MAMDTIRAGFAAVPGIKTQSWLRNQTISGIEQEREKAYRVRNYAMRTLLAVDTIHRPRDTNERLCTCGLPAHDCRVNRALEDERHYLYEWENRQRDNAHKRIEDFLPDDHPDHITESLAIQFSPTHVPRPILRKDGRGCHHCRLPAVPLMA